MTERWAKKEPPKGSTQNTNNPIKLRIRWEEQLKLRLKHKALPKKRNTTKRIMKCWEEENHSEEKMSTPSKWIAEKEQAVKINYKAWSITIKRKGQQQQTLIIRRLRHPSLLCTVCTQENHCRHIHSLPHLITHSNWKQQDSKNENSPHLMDGHGTFTMLQSCSSSRDAWLSSTVIYSM